MADEGGTVVINPLITQDIEDNLGSLGSTVIFGSGFAGNYHNLRGLVEHDDPFDLEHPLVPGPSDDNPRRILPVGVVLAHLRMSLEPLAQLFTLLNSRPEIGGIVHFSPPPPPPDNALLADRLASEGKTAAPPALRLKLWHCQQQIFAEICERAGALLIEQPAGLLLADGYLPSHLCRDGLHGDWRYGTEMLVEADRRLRQGGIGVR